MTVNEKQTFYNEWLIDGHPHALPQLEMLMVQKTEGAGRAIFTLSGRIEQKDLLALKELIQADANPTRNTLDLKEVKLVDSEVIVFLASCEAVGIKLENCPPYVRMWIDTRRDARHEA